jgi:hypothetical protein
LSEFILIIVGKFNYVEFATSGSEWLIFYFKFEGFYNLQ